MADENDIGGVLGALSLGGGEINQDRLKSVLEQTNKQLEGARTAAEKQGSVLQQANEAYLKRMQMTRDLIASQKPDNTAQWLAFASGLLKPTKTGAPFESVGMGLEAMNPHVAAADKQRREQAMQLAGLDEKAAEFGYKAEQDKYKSLLELQREYERSLRAVNTASIRGGATPDPRKNFVHGGDGKLYDISDPKNPKLVAGSGKAMAEAVPQQDATPDFANRMGVPMAEPQAAPWAGLPETQSAQVRAAIAKDFAKGQESDIETINAAKNKLALMSEYEALQRKVTTGGWYSKIPDAVRKPFDADFERMAAISDELTPGMRQPGSGSSSDLDVKMFKSATIDPKKNPETNMAIINAIRRQNENVIQFTRFKENYFQTNKHLGGAEQAWQQYLDANPIFDPRSTPDKPALNATRLGWQEFFRKTPAEREKMVQLTRKLAGE